MKTYRERIKEIQERIGNYTCVNDFYKDNPYLYKWALKNNIDIKKYYPNQKRKKNVRCKYDDRDNKGIDCYLVGTGKLFKHYPFIIDALRDLDLTYYYVHRILSGKLDSIDGYTFVRCNE